MTRERISSNVSWSSTCQPNAVTSSAGPRWSRNRQAWSSSRKRVTSVVELVDVQADGVGAEALPVGEPVGLDHEVAELDRAEDVDHAADSDPVADAVVPRRGTARPARRNRSACSICTQ